MIAEYKNVPNSRNEKSLVSVPSWRRNMHSNPEYKGSSCSTTTDSANNKEIYCNTSLTSLSTIELTESKKPKSSILASLQRRIAKTKICVHNLHGRCSKASNCPFAHSNLELREPPNLYKTRLCVNFDSKGSCSYGSNCRFAHGEQELRWTPEFYKTSLCPFRTIGCSLGDNCRWAHSPEELRRRTEYDEPRNNFKNHMGCGQEREKGIEKIIHETIVHPRSSRVEKSRTVLEKKGKDFYAERICSERDELEEEKNKYKKKTSYNCEFNYSSMRSSSNQSSILINTLSPEVSGLPFFSSTTNGTEYETFYNINRYILEYPDAKAVDSCDMEDEDGEDTGAFLVTQLSCPSYLLSSCYVDKD